MQANVTLAIKCSNLLSMSTVRLQQRTAQQWEPVFTAWSVGPGTTEKEKCENTEKAIRKAIDADSALNSRTIRIFAQGSYRNHTNVRQDSDVDICVLCTDICFTDYSSAEGIDDSKVGLSTSSYTYAMFKNEVGTALRNYFGASVVSRGNKAFDIHATTYRVDADVVPCLEHRRYDRNGKYISGTELHPDNGGRVTNWPDQQYENGVLKHVLTKARFKKIVRILKNLRYEMEDQGIATAKCVPSYLVECLVFNVPNELFEGMSFHADVRAALLHLWDKTRTQDTCNEWGEVNELKYLFRSSQPWTREQANDFLLAAWSYTGIK